MVSDAELISQAAEARLAAYAPYSQFKVGAALLGENGEVFTGCNVENISFGLTICAERAALFSAVRSGVRRFVRIAIVAGETDPAAPCGACRQCLAEFSPEMTVVSVSLSGRTVCDKLELLLPSAARGILDR